MSSMFLLKASSYSSLPIALTFLLQVRKALCFDLSWLFIIIDKASLYPLM